MTSLVIEGYASLFGVEDFASDIVHPGAFARALALVASPMLPAAQFIRIAA